MDDNDSPRSENPGAPRRPRRSRARPGGSVRPVPQGDGGRGDRGGRRPGETPTQAMPLAPSQPQHAGVHHHADPHAQPAAANGQVPPGQVPPGQVPPGQVPPGEAPGSGPARRRRRLPRSVRLTATLLALVLVVLCGWFGGLALWANSRIDHVDALSDAENTPGTTYLVAGSDSRSEQESVEDDAEGQRTDTMMLLHKARNGNSYLVSLPRDTLVDVPGQGEYKLNAAYALGGPSLLVETVEQFTGLTVDHYLEIGFDGVADLVDSVGTVNLCIDQDVDDEKSGLQMTEGCHDLAGDQALAFVRARSFDPTADMGRQQRQQEFVGAFMDRVTDPGVLLNPLSQVKLARSGSDALVTSEGTGLFTVGRAGLAMRSAMNSSAGLEVPIADPEYQTQNSGVALLPDDDATKALFAEIRDGTAETGG